MVRPPTSCRPAGVDGSPSYVGPGARGQRVWTVRPPTLGLGVGPVGMDGSPSSTGQASGCGRFALLRGLGHAGVDGSPSYAGQVVGDPPPGRDRFGWLMGAARAVGPGRLLPNPDLMIIKGTPPRVSCYLAPT